MFSGGLVDGMYPIRYIVQVYQVLETETFAKWLGRLRDRDAKARIASRLKSVREGNLGDTKSVDEGIRELRIHTGPGYRIYFVQRGMTILVLLCGGDKSSQARDIQLAKRLARELEE